MTSDSIPPALIAATESDELPEAVSVQNTSPGLAVRSARERARLSLEELATQTKLARSTLEALERDDFNALNEAVYVRGYYRKCAKVLALPDAELIAAYEKLVVPKAPPMPTKLLLGSSPAIGRPRIRRRSGPGRLILLVLATALIAAVIWFRVNDPALKGLRGAAPAVESAPASLASPAVSSVQAPPTATTPVQGSASGPSVPAATFETPAPPPTVPSPVAAAAAAPSIASSGSPSTTNIAAVESASGLLALTFNATSWVRVEDAEGRLLLSGVLQAGDRQELRGRPPYSVFVGNAPGVAVEYDGRPIDTSPFVKANSTARLTVP